jgi:hypothetical protein
MNGEVNYPTPADRELFDHLVEELGEVLQEIGKIGRHGLDRRYGALDNRERLELEIGHVRAAIDLLLERLIVDVGALENARIKKLATIQQWLHHPENVAAARALIEASE